MAEDFGCFEEAWAVLIGDLMGVFFFVFAGAA
jgi:hypothetical protein